MSELSAAWWKILFTGWNFLKISFKYSHVCPSPSFPCLHFSLLPITVLQNHWQYSKSNFFQLWAFRHCVKDKCIPPGFWSHHFLCKLLEILLCEYKQECQITRKYIMALDPSNNTLPQCVYLNKRKCVVVMTLPLSAMTLQPLKKKKVCAIQQCFSTPVLGTHLTECFRCQ